MVGYGAVMHVYVHSCADGNGTAQCRRKGAPNPNDLFVLSSSGLGSRHAEVWDGMQTVRQAVGDCPGSLFQPGRAGHKRAGSGIIIISAGSGIIIS